MNTNDSPNSAHAASPLREIVAEATAYIADKCTGDPELFPDMLHARLEAMLVQFETTPGVDVPSGFVERPSHPITPDAVSHEHAAAARALKRDLMERRGSLQLTENEAEHYVALAVRRLIKGERS